ncbi:MAG: response regulator [Deltaproteobacteria bacterium]|nr:response regulator [Deltaproteobacteria bacterium]MBW2019877.1 response regulator [Deltaproteobacteria bacterium]MBW2074986.1 response regulator [Deltaproteobacteria bacterium]
MMANILIIDDQPCVRKLLSEELIIEGYQVHSLGHAESVREHLLSSQPDLVLLDLYLEGPEGFGLFEDIKRQYPHMPVIIVTAYDSFMDDPRVSHADGYVIKSIHLDELKQKIAQVLTPQQDLQTTEEPKPHCPELRVVHGF